MAIAFDTATADFASASSQTFAHTCSGSNRILFVATRAGTTDNVTGATYGGVAMTLVNKVLIASGSRYLYLFMLVNPASGANNVVLTASGSVDFCSFASSYTGAKQTGQPDAHTTNTNNGTSPYSASLTTVADNSWVVAIAYNDAGGAAAGTGTALRASNCGAGPAFIDSNGAVTPAGSRALEITHNASTVNRAMVLASIAPVSAIQHDQNIDASTSVSASILTPKTIVQTITGSAGVVASVSMIKDFMRTLDAGATATATVLKGLTMDLTASVTSTADMVVTRVFLLTLEALTSATATMDKAMAYARTLEATATATASMARQIATSVAMTAETTVTATIDLVREIVMTATVATEATITTLIGKTLDATVSIVAKISAPFWRTKYPAHGDEDDYEIKYPHE